MIGPGVNTEHHEKVMESAREIRTTSLLLFDHEWRYHVSGTGPPSLLVLSGSLGASAGTTRLISDRLPTTRVVVPEYAPVATMDECVQALNQILKEEEIDRIAVFGGSFGGLIAQFWAQHNPSRVTHLILSGTAPPDPSRLTKHARAIQVLPLIPLPLIRLLMRGLLRGIKEPRWSREYLKLIASCTKQDLKSRYQLAMDFDCNHCLVDLPASVQVLILEGERDRVATAGVRDRMRHVYPHARSHVFKGAGHSPIITHPEEWSDLVSGFLECLP